MTLSAACSLGKCPRRRVALRNRSSYNRRSAAERTNATTKAPSTTDINRGWCRLTGLTAVTLLLTCALVVRNTRIIDAYGARTAQPRPTNRRRRRETLDKLIDTG